MSQFLSTLEVRKTVVGCTLLPGYHPSIRINYASPSQSPQAALRVPLFEQVSKSSFEVIK